MQKIGFCERYMLTTAVLERFKTNTRRLEKALERAVAEYEKQHGESFEIITQYWDEKRKKVCCLTKHGIIHVGTNYKLNEVVAVAQSYEDIYHHGGPEYGSYELVNNYRRLHIRPWKDITQQAGWSNKMFVKPSLMPHQIQITGIRIERLQDISDADCIKEGIIQSVDGVNMFTFDGWIKKGYQQYSYTSPREAFAALIDRPGVGRKGLWEDNPFVVVYEFKLVK